MRSLAADPSFSEVRVEATWRASEGLAGLRRPDVSAIRMVKVIETARAGEPVGFGHETLLEVAHYLFHQRPELLKGFGYLLHAYGKYHLLAEQDTSGKWAGKVAANREAMRHDPRFRLAEDEQRLFDFLSDDLCRKPA